MKGNAMTNYISNTFSNDSWNTIKKIGILRYTGFNVILFRLLPLVAFAHILNYMMKNPIGLEISANTFVFLFIQSLLLGLTIGPLEWFFLRDLHKTNRKPLLIAIQFILIYGTISWTGIIGISLNLFLNTTSLFRLSTLGIIGTLLGIILWLIYKTLVLNFD